MPTATPLRHVAASLVIVLMAALSGCASTPRGTGLVAPVEVNFTEPVPGFTVKPPMADNDPSVGTQVTAVSAGFPELKLDVFAYLVGPYDSPSAALVDMEREFIATLELAQSQGLYSNLKWSDRQDVRVYVRGLPRHGRHLRAFVTGPDGGAYVTHTHLFYRPPFAIKFRSTFPAAGNTAFDDEIRRFVEASLLHLQVAAPGLCVDDAVLVSADPGAGRCAMVAAIGEGFLRRAMAGCADYEAGLLMKETGEMARRECEQQPEPAQSP